MKLFTVLSAILFSCQLFAADAYTEGKDYQAITPTVRTSDASKIEVTEVFAYSCPHCFHFEPLVSVWEKKQPADVKFVQMHAMWNPQMEPMMRGFYTMQVLKLQAKAHLAAFNVIHLEHKTLNNAEQWANFLSLYGVDKDKILKTYDSFGVSSLIKQADARQRSFKISGTPEMVVDGKYRVSSREAGSQEDMLKVVDFLIAKIRAERAPALSKQ
jgi:thiol:disulfide interchange protein DsbA